MCGMLINTIFLNLCSLLKSKTLKSKNGLAVNVADIYKITHQNIAVSDEAERYRIIDATQKITPKTAKKYGNASFRRAETINIIANNIFTANTANNATLITSI
jgi:hypothetical protein